MNRRKLACHIELAGKLHRRWSSYRRADRMVRGSSVAGILLSMFQPDPFAHLGNDMAVKWPGGKVISESFTFGVDGDK